MGGRRKAPLTSIRDRAQNAGAAGFEHREVGLEEAGGVVAEVHDGFADVAEIGIEFAELAMGPPPRQQLVEVRDDVDFADQQILCGHGVSPLPTHRTFACPAGSNFGCNNPVTREFVSGFRGEKCADELVHHLRGAGRLVDRQ